MNTLNLPKLNHNSDSLHGVFALNFYQKQFVHHAVLFEVISSSLLIEDLYDNPDEAPTNLTAMSGILERAYEHVSTKEEKFFLLLTFIGVYDKLWVELNKAKEEKKAQETPVRKGKRDIKDILAELFTHMHENPVLKLVDLVKESNMDFSKFINRCLPIEKMNEINAAEELVMKAKKDMSSNVTSLEDLLKKFFDKDSEED